MNEGPTITMNLVTPRKDYEGLVGKWLFVSSPKRRILWWRHPPRIVVAATPTSMVMRPGRWSWLRWRWV